MRSECVIRNNELIMLRVHTHIPDTVLTATPAASSTDSGVTEQAPPLPSPALQLPGTELQRVPRPCQGSLNTHQHLTSSVEAGEANIASRSNGVYIEPENIYFSRFLLLCFMGFKHSLCLNVVTQ